MDGPKTIDSFCGENDFLSNFFVGPEFIEYDSLLFPTIEHAYQAAKTIDPIERELILCSRTPGVAKRRGRKVALRHDWQDVRISVMLDLLRKKFLNMELATKLLATGDSPLIEGNWWGDTFWGVCRGSGENHLGKLLMQVREDLRLQRISPQ